MILKKQSMHLFINDNITIGEIRKKFQNRFPFLNLEFFSHVKENNYPNPLQRVLDETKKLSVMRPVHHAGELKLSGSEKVSTLENLFSDRFGLNVQVSRKSGTNWLLTKQTDDFTLDHQNEIGMEMSIAVEQTEPLDIHEQE
jgi:hypothetical protein